MEHALYFNHLCLPASHPDTAYVQLCGSLLSALEMNGGEDRYAIYYEADEPDGYMLAEGFSFGDFMDTLLQRGEVDLLTFLLEAEDKAPLLDVIDPELLERLADCSYFWPEPECFQQLDLIGAAWLQGGVLLSLPTGPRWETHRIAFRTLPRGEYRPQECQAWNVSRQGHGSLIANLRRTPITEQFPDVSFDDTFLQWFSGCKVEDQAKVRAKLQHCRANDFRLGRPVVDTLEGSKYANMKEIRAGNAHGQSGQLRILFAIDPIRRPNVLVGFIKHSNDYEAHIKVADDLFSRVLEAFGESGEA